MHKHQEIHVATTHEDAETLTLAGLTELTLYPAECEACGNSVGPHGERYIPVALVLNEASARLLCLSCAGPVIRT